MGELRQGQRKSDPVAPRVQQPLSEVVIRTAAGAPVTTRRSVPRWQSLRKPGPKDEERADARYIKLDALVEERHHHYYGRPWILGRLYFDHLVEWGLDPDARVLDVGCGAGRLGIWLLRYLNPARYFGIDNHLRSLTAFARYEIPLHGLADRRPSLMLSATFEADRFGHDFDVILDCSVTQVIPPDMADLAWRRMRTVLASNGRILTPNPPVLGFDRLREIGLRLTSEKRVTYPILQALARPINATDHWHEFANASAATRPGRGRSVAGREPTG